MLVGVFLSTGAKLWVSSESDLLYLGVLRYLGNNDNQRIVEKITLTPKKRGEDIIADIKENHFVYYSCN